MTTREIQNVANSEPLKRLDKRRLKSLLITAKRPEQMNSLFLFYRENSYNCNSFCSNICFQLYLCVGKRTEKKRNKALNMF